MMRVSEYQIYDDKSELQPLSVKPLATAVMVRQADGGGTVMLTRQMLRELLRAMDEMEVRDPDAEGGR